MTLLASTLPCKKLNLGCGFDYRPGYINADFHNSSTADLQIDAAALDFPSGWFDEIMLRDFIEHIGFCESYFLLTQLYLLLDPAGSLVIQTPDLDCSLRQYAQARSTAERENILCWVYGVEDPGMSHKFCFPEELLRSLAAQCGFEIALLDRFEEHLFRPNMLLRLTRANTAQALRKNRIVHELHTKTGLRISYADLPYFENIVVRFLQIETEPDLEKFLASARYLSPKLALLLLERCILPAGFCEQCIAGSIGELQDLLQFNFFGAAESAGADFDNALEIVRAAQGKVSFFAEGAPAFDFFTRENYHKFLAYLSGLSRKRGKGG